VNKNPYAQVALTYVRRPFSSGKNGLLSVGAILLFILMVFGLGRIGHGQNFAVQQLLPLTFLYLFLVVHAKDQCADPRARLMPGFRRVHAAIAAAAAAVCGVLLPAAIAWLLEWHSIGFVALAVALLATILWMLLTMSGWVILPGLAVWCWLPTEVGRECVQQLVTGKFEPQAAALLAIGLALTVIGGIRLFRLNEDMRAYRWIKWELWRGRVEAIGPQFTDDPITKVVKDWIVERHVARLTRHARQASDSRWSRVCRWQVGMVTGWTLWLSILGAAFFIHLAYWWLPPKPTRGAAYGAIVVISYILALMPSTAIVGAAVRRSGMFGYEVLRPVDRKAYVRQLGAATALNQFQLWLGGSVVSVGWWLLLGPQPFPAVTLAGVLLASAAFQVMAFAIVAWTALHRWRWLGVVAVMGLFPIGQIVLMRFLASPLGQLPVELMWLAAAITALGLLLTYAAYRRWLLADVD
jgi:hypothetical protein